MTDPTAPLTAEQFSNSECLVAAGSVAGPCRDAVEWNIGVGRAILSLRAANAALTAERDEAAGTVAAARDRWKERAR